MNEEIKAHLDFFRATHRDPPPPGYGRPFLTQRDLLAGRADLQEKENLSWLDRALVNGTPSVLDVLKARGWRQDLSGGCGPQE